MVKGISRQVIMVHSPDPKLFDQAIFILKDSAVREGITDADLLRQAREAIGREHGRGTRILFRCLWTLAGAGITGAVWAAVYFL